MTTAKRYNVFNNIHKALRSMLFSIQMKVQQTDFGMPGADSVIAELERILGYYDEHADHEDRHILSQILRIEPQLVAELEADHVQDHALSDRLRRHIRQWHEGADRDAAGRDIFYTLNDFIAFNLYHMNKEECVLLPLLWKHFTDQDIHAMEQRILASIDPETLMAESRWMMRSISDNEIRGWLGGVKMGAPEAVYQSFVKMAGEELPAVRFAGLQLEAAAS